MIIISEVWSRHGEKELRFWRFHASANVFILSVLCIRISLLQPSCALFFELLLLFLNIPHPFFYFRNSAPNRYPLFPMRTTRCVINEEIKIAERHVHDSTSRTIKGIITRDNTRSERHVGRMCAIHSSYKDILGRRFNVLKDLRLWERGGIVHVVYINSYTLSQLLLLKGNYYFSEVWSNSISSVRLQ